MAWTFDVLTYPGRASRIMKHLNAWRCPSPGLGPLDMDATAKRQEIEIVFRDDMTGLGRLSVWRGKTTIAIKQSQSPAERLFTFAHELAHLACMKEGFLPWQPNNPPYWLMECAVDFYARDLLIPPGMAGLKGQSIAKAAKSWNVTSKTLVLQLMKQGWFTDPFVFQKELLCLGCGQGPPEALDEEGLREWWRQVNCSCRENRLSQEIANQSRGKTISNQPKPCQLEFTV